MGNRYHRVLGVSGDANPTELKAAFRKLARRYHPDTCAEAEGDAAEKFIEIVAAYRALTNDVGSNKVPPLGGKDYQVSVEVRGGKLRKWPRVHQTGARPGRRGNIIDVRV